MDCEIFGNGSAICGNFAEVQPEKPKDFDYMSTAKWLEDYPLDKRECIGGTICSCKKVLVHYAPYYGWDYFHVDTCNLMRKLKDRPQLGILWAYDHLPSIQFSGKAVPADTPVGIYIRTSSVASKIKVRRVGTNNLQLFAI